MEAKKEIGFVVKEALQNYSSTPDDSVWEHIAGDLKKDQRRRRILLYWLLGAALLLIPVLVLINAPEVSEKKQENLDKDTIITNDQTQPTPITSNSTKAIDSIETPKTQLSSDVPNDRKDDCACESSSKTSIEENEELSTINKTRPKEKKTIHLLDETDIKEHNTDSKNELADKVIEKKRTPKKPKKKITEIKKQEKKKQPEEEWSIFPYVSLDHYNAFKLKTTKQHSINYGLYLSYYTTKETAIRIGFKKLSLSYDFVEGNQTNTQKVSYLEIPLELRYILNTKSSLKPSFMGGISYLFLDDASLINTSGTLSNKDAFTNNILSFNLGTGLHKDLDKHFSVNAELFFQLHLKPYTQNFDSAPYTLSFKIGVEYKF